MRWLDDEHRILMDRVRQAKQGLLSDSAILPELALAMFGYHEARRRWIEMREITEGAVDAATSQGCQVVAAWLQHDAAIPEAENGDIVTAVDRITLALPMFREIGDQSGQSRCCSSLAYLLGVLGRIDEALVYGEEALTLSRAIKDRTLEGVSQTAVGALYNRRSEFARADAAFAEAVSLALGTDDLRSMSKRYMNAAMSHLQVGRYRDARLDVMSSLRVAEQIRDQVTLAEGHHLLALAFAAEGSYDQARINITTGLELAGDSGDLIREGRLNLDLARIDAALSNRLQALDELRDAITKLHLASAIQEAEALELQAQLQQGKPYHFNQTAYSL